MKLLSLLLACYGNPDDDTDAGAWGVLPLWPTGRRRASQGHRRVAGWSTVGSPRQRIRLPGPCLPRPSMPRGDGHGLRAVHHRGRCGR